MEQITEELRAFKHDYKNILAEMAGYIREGQIDELKKYYYKIMQTDGCEHYKDMHVWKSLRNIQSMELKGLLYEKTLNILNKNIELKILYLIRKRALKISNFQLKNRPRSATIFIAMTINFRKVIFHGTRNTN